MSRVFLKNLFGRHLFLTNTVLSGCLLGTGDALQQIINQKQKHGPKEAFDWPRTGRMVAVGVMLGPMAHFWYRFLDKKLPETLAKTVLKKVAADQVVAAPVLNLTFFLGMGALEGNTWRQTSNEIKQKFVYVYLIDWLFWPPVQALNFFLVPQAFRVLYVNVALLLWDTFLSRVKHEYD